MLKCSECGIVLKPEDKDKKWQELLRGYPSCISCDEKTFQDIDSKMKIIHRPQLAGHRE